jgi:hypothetical protein
MFTNLVVLDLTASSTAERNSGDSANVLMGVLTWNIVLVSKFYTIY